ncbi:hypothetical protein E2C01_068839 [Portunus trituberculatus]|uniref:Uncharacterized protein n=1 Tax=Portunus trituberculatus TaxID=210409 RepID=A0A5B7HXS7_PORTR|nr:hypothetical protein [Portunus trituberculatus]
MYQVVGPQPFALPVSDMNYHHSYQSPDDEGQDALYFSPKWVHEGLPRWEPPSRRGGGLACPCDLAS